MIRQKGVALRKPRPPPEGLFCMYPHRTCMQNRLDGYDFCLKHILEDKNSVYKQCNYMSGKTGKRCPWAAPKSDKKEGYCMEHARRSQALRQRATRRRRPRETPETLLEQIEHYATRTEPGGSGGAGGRADKRGRPSNESIVNRILEYASSSDSETEAAAVEAAWRGDCDSDAESVDSEQEDPLKHAGVYTAEEVALITKDKLIRLQSLYIEQFKRLQHVMREKRRKYLHTARMERDTLGSVHSAREDPEQRETYEKLVAMKRYHRRFGKEALLHRQSKERRISTSDGPNYKPPSFPRCQHVQPAGNKCLARAMPLSKFCPLHILDDQYQVLYGACVFGGGACSRPVALPLGGTGEEGRQYCTAHGPLPDAPRRFPPPQHLLDDKDIDVVNDSAEIVMETSSVIPSASQGGSGDTVGPSAAFTDPAVGGVPAAAAVGSHTASRPSSRAGSRPSSRPSSRPPSRASSRPHTPQVTPSSSST